MTIHNDWKKQPEPIDGLILMRTVLIGAIIIAALIGFTVFVEPVCVMIVNYCKG